jgi:hypothetical protein
VWAFTDQRQRIAGRLSYTRFFGRLTRQSTRAHQLSFAFDAAWLNPNFRRDEAPASGVDLPQARYTIGGSMAWFWDSRLTSLFPMRGSRFQLAVGAGGAPETRESFVTLSGAATTILPFSPRHVAATRLAVGAAITDIPQSRNRFGGTGGVRGIPDNAVQTELQAVASLEYRAAPIRGASIPLGVLYIEEIDLTLAVDGGVGVADGGRVAGLGATAGVNLITENLGLAPGSVNVSVGLPLLWSGFELERRSPQLYIGWGFGF